MALEGGDTRYTLDLTLKNVTPLPLSGSLQLLPPAGFSAGSPEAAVNLSPGEDVSLERFIQGEFQAGARVPIRATLNLPGGALELPDIVLSVAPQQLWRQWVDGAVTGFSPPGFPLEGGSVYATERGEIGKVWPNGYLLWESHLPAAFVKGPARGLSRGGEAYAVLDARGKLHLCLGTGAYQGILQESAENVTDFVWVPTFDYPYDALVVTRRGGQVACVSAEGVTRWELELGQYSPRLAAGAECVFIAASNAGKSKLMAVDRAGGVVWEAQPDEGPIRIDVNGQGGGARKPGGRSGQRADPAFHWGGSPDGSTSSGNGASRQQPGAPGRCTSRRAALLLAQDATLYALSGQLEVVWQQKLPQIIRGLAWVEWAKAPAIGVASEGPLRILDAQGKTPFAEDPRPSLGLNQLERWDTAVAVAWCRAGCLSEHLAASLKQADGFKTRPMIALGLHEVRRGWI